MRASLSLQRVHTIAVTVPTSFPHSLGASRRARASVSGTSAPGFADSLQPASHSSRRGTLRMQVGEKGREERGGKGGKGNDGKKEISRLFESGIRRPRQRRRVLQKPRSKPGIEKLRLVSMDREACIREENKSDLEATASCVPCWKELAGIRVFLVIPFRVCFFPLSSLFSRTISNSGNENFIILRVYEIGC